MKITCRRSTIIDLSDPARILGSDVICGKVAGVPTILLRPETLLSYKDYVRDHIEDMAQDAAAEENARYGWGERLSRFISGKRDAFGRAINIFPNSIAHVFNRTMAEEVRHGFSVPTAHITRPPQQPLLSANSYGPGIYEPSLAAIVTMAPSDMRFSDMFNFQRHVTRIGCPPIDPGKEIFHYTVACHEIGHVAGGAEPQADKISALFTRRAFGRTPTTDMLADFRAIETTMTGVTRLKIGNTSGVDENPYGWEMVEALDEVAAMPQYKIADMSDADIFETVFTPCPRDTERCEALVALLFNALPDKPFFMQSYHILEVGQAAEDVMRQTERINDPALHRMAMRLALAAHRVTAGNKGYRFQL